MCRSAPDTENVVVSDTTPPVITAGFFDEQTGEPVTQITHSDRVIIHYAATDVCDAAPSVTAVTGTRVDDGQVFNVSTGGKLIIKEMESLDLSVQALDSSGNNTAKNVISTVTGE